MREAMLTTIDNPYDPFDDFEHWRVWDEEHGYNCLGILASISMISNEQSEETIVNDIEVAIDDFIADDVFYVFKKVVKDIDYIGNRDDE